MEPSASMGISPMDVISAIINGKSDDAAGEVVSYVIVLTTSMAVLIGCAVVLMWRRSNGSKSRAIEPPKPLMVKAPKVEVDDGKKKVTVFFGTQTGTAEGFAKVGLRNYVRKSCVNLEF